MSDGEVVRADVERFSGDVVACSLIGEMPDQTNGSTESEADPISSPFRRRRVAALTGQTPGGGTARQFAGGAEA